MVAAFYVFAAITALFFTLLLLKTLIKSKSRLCVICASVSITWIALLALYWKGYFENTVLLGMLMGQSVTGIFYLVEKKTKKELHVFRLPFLLTLTFAFYSLLTLQGNLKTAALVSALWAAFLLLFIYRKNSKANAVVKKLIECCKNW